MLLFQAWFGRGNLTRNIDHMPTPVLSSTRTQRTTELDQSNTNP